MHMRLSPSTFAHELWAAALPRKRYSNRVIVGLATFTALPSWCGAFWRTIKPHTVSFYALQKSM